MVLTPDARPATRLPFNQFRRARNNPLCAHQSAVNFLNRCLGTQSSNYVTPRARGNPPRDCPSVC